MNGRGKDPEDDIQQVKQPCHGNPGHDISRQPGEAVGDKGEEDRGEPYRHDPYVGDDVADALQQLQGREQSAREEKKRGQEEYRNDDRADEHGREKPGERRHRRRDAKDDDNCEESVKHLPLFFFPESGDRPEDETEEDMDNAYGYGKAEHGHDSGAPLDAEGSDAEESLREVTKELAIEQTEEYGIQRGDGEYLRTVLHRPTHSVPLQQQNGYDTQDEAIPCVTE